MRFLLFLATILKTAITVFNFFHCLVFHSFDLTCSDDKTVIYDCEM